MAEILHSPSRGRTWLNDDHLPLGATALERAVQIGELAKQSDLTVSSIRFYEAQGLISVSRRANGYRVYSAEALVALNIITSARDAGFTLAEIRHLMAGDLSHCRDGGFGQRPAEESR